MIELTGRANGILLRVYGVGRKLFEGIKSLYENASASVLVNGELSESFNPFGTVTPSLAS